MNWWNETLNGGSESTNDHQPIGEQDRRNPDIIPPEFEAIPDRLKQRRQWICWRGEYDQDKGKYSKVPTLPGNTFSKQIASKNNAAHWGTFDDALLRYRDDSDVLGIGYIVTKDDNLSMIDLDNCVVDGELTQFAQDFVNSIMSYSELSPSGKGVRIIAEGRLPGPQFNNHKIGVEMYDGVNGNAFLTITGHVIDDLCDIEDRFNEVQFHYEQHKTDAASNPAPEVNIGDVPERVELRGIMPSTLSLIHGSGWSDYPSRSEIVYGVCLDLLIEGYSTDEVLSIVTDPNYKIAEVSLDRRKTRVSAQQWVSKYPLSSAVKTYEERKQVFVDTDALVRNILARQSANNVRVDEETGEILEPVDSGSTEFNFDIKSNRLHLPGRLKNPPGLVGEIADYVLANSIRPQENYAIAAGLMAVSFCSMNRYRVEYAGGSGLNLYLTLVGGTGSGKEAPRKAIRKILKSINELYLMPENIASGPALLRGLDRNKRLLFTPDEFGLMLQSALGSHNAQSHLKDLAEEMMKMYGRALDTWSGKIYADMKVKIDPIDHPYLCLLGTTTPEQFAAALSKSDISSGFLNRILYIETDDELPAKRFDQIEADLPQNIIDGIAKIAQSHILFDNSGQFKSIHVSDPAIVVLNEFSDFCDRQALGDPQFGSLWIRAHEHAIRIAGIMALGCAESIDAVWIQTNHVNWALTFTEWCFRRLRKHLDEHMADSEFDARCKRALMFIANAHKYAGDKKFGWACAMGKMPRGKLVKLMRLSTRELDTVLDFLVCSEEIGCIPIKQDGSHKESVVFFIL